RTTGRSAAKRKRRTLISEGIVQRCKEICNAILGAGMDGGSSDGDERKRQLLSSISEKGESYREGVFLEF
ncbi:hypothetical protein A2U01_0035007, partial [Trifolium medium]|nr:hypothetical protein [Trifolium medium]